MIMRFIQWLFVAIFVLSQGVMSLGVSSHAQANTLSDAELAAYTLPDGSLPVICLTPNEDGSTSHVMCEGCLCCPIDGAAFALGEGIRNTLGFGIKRASEQLVPVTRVCLQRTRGPPLSV